MLDRPLRVFVSSKMQELASERREIKAALDALRIDAWVFEEDAGAQSQPIQKTYLEALSESDLYLGVFWNEYGDRTIEEFEHARLSHKDCLIYEKHLDVERRAPQLDAFLKRISNVETGLTLSRFLTIEQLKEKVRADLARWQAMMARQALSKRIDDERKRLARGRAKEGESPRQRIVNLAPQGVAEQFKDRTTLAADIYDTLVVNRGIRAVTVCGQGGVGKTALACQVMRALEDDEVVHGLVYLSTRTTDITFERIYRDSARMLGGAVEGELMKAWQQQDRRTASKIQGLLEAYAQRRCIFLLDNVETIMDEGGVLVEPELQQFFDAFLAQGHGARLLITSREPLRPANENRKYQKVVPLEEGLPSEFAVELLRDLDRTGKLGLRDAPARLMHLAVKKTQGYPAALEAIYSMLSEERGLRLEVLLDDEKLFGDNVIKNMVRAALTRLDADGRRVMQALAVFERPVREVAVHDLLEPYMPAVNVHETLHRLRRGLYVNGGRSSKELILHPFYREFSYGEIPVDAQSAYNRVALENRAAEYYAKLWGPPETWRSGSNLEHELPEFEAEFEHRVRAGEYDRAARMLAPVDTDLLIWRGYARRVQAMRTSLDGRILDPRLLLHHHNSLGQISLIVGPHEDGVRHFTRMKELATEVGEPSEAATALLYLGESCRLLGRREDAVEHLAAALAFFRGQDERAELIYCLLYLGLAHCHARHAHAAIDCGEELLQRSGRWPTLNTVAKAHNVLSLAYIVLEQWDPAAEHARQAIDAYTAAGSLDACYVENLEGMALFGAQRCEESIATFERAVAHARKNDLPRAEALILFNHARVCRSARQQKKALQSARKAVKLMIEGHFQPLGTARSFVDALRAAAAGDSATEIGRLLDCARGSLMNADLQPATDLLKEVEVRATEMGLERLAEEARELELRSRSSQREPPPSLDKYQGT